MTPALATAQSGLESAARRFGAASSAIVATSAYAAAQASGSQTSRAIQPPIASQNGMFGGGGAGSGQLPLPDGLLFLLQGIDQAMGRGRSGSLPSIERSTVDSILAQRAFEANLRTFQAADRQLGEALNLVI